MSKSKRLRVHSTVHDEGRNAEEYSSSLPDKKRKRKTKELDEVNPENVLSKGEGAHVEKRRKKEKKSRKLDSTTKTTYTTPEVELTLQSELECMQADTAIMVKFSSESDEKQAQGAEGLYESRLEKRKKKRREVAGSEGEDVQDPHMKVAKTSCIDLRLVTPAVSPESKNRAKEKKHKEKKPKKQIHDDENSPDIQAPFNQVNEASEQNTQEMKEKKRRRPDTDQANTTTHPSTTLSSTLPTINDVDISAYLLKHHINIVTPPSSTPITPIFNFASLPIPQPLLTAFSAGFKEPTPIQACTWPAALEGKDVVGIAETGSGKTLAFGIPALAQLITSVSLPHKPSVTTLVVAPTRELALQTHDTLSTLGESFGIGSVAVFGGVPKEGQVKLLRNLDKGSKGKITTRVVVGTPGRILDLIQEGVCDLSQVNYLVLDEADRMLDKGFENDIRKIISHTKQGKQRQTMMFSATWPDAVRRLASTFQQDPVRVTVGSDDLTANSRVEQVLEVLDDSRMKDSRLLTLLRDLAPKGNNKKVSSLPLSPNSRILVFALYKKEASRVESMLRRQGYTVGALHGDMSQSARLEALENFKNGTTKLLVATDVAARGLDIPDVEAVINYTFPLTIEDYIHRIGRTGRAGRSGKSITFFTGDNHERGLAGELARVLREGGFQYDALKKFPMSIKKKTHSAYGAFFRDDIPMPTGPTKIVFGDD